MKCCKYKAGMLRTPVEFQRKTQTRTSSGGFSEAWAAISGAPTKAHVEALSGSERVASDRVEAHAKFRLVTRYFSGLTAADRVKIGDRLHNIRAIDNVEMRDRWLRIDLDGGVAT